MKDIIGFFLILQIILLVILVGIVIFGLIPAQYKLFKIDYMISKDMRLEKQCHIDAYKHNGLDTKKCLEYWEFNKKYERWLLNET